MPIQLASLPLGNKCVKSSGLDASCASLLAHLPRYAFLNRKKTKKKKKSSPRWMILALGRLSVTLGEKEGIANSP